MYKNRHPTKAQNISPIEKPNLYSPSDSPNSVDGVNLSDFGVGIAACERAEAIHSGTFGTRSL